MDNSAIRLPDYKKWKANAERALKGRPIETFASETYDGLSIDPLYGRSIGLRPHEHVRDGGWKIIQNVDDPDPCEANRHVLDDLENGSSGVSLVFKGSRAVRNGIGMEPTNAVLKRVLSGVHLEAEISVDIQCAENDWSVIADALTGIVSDQRIDPGNCSIRFGLDPVGSSLLSGGVRSGDGPSKVDEERVVALRKKGFAGPYFIADGCIIHDAGGSEVQELAYVLACGVRYVRGMAHNQIPVGDAMGMIQARMSADADQLMTIAKFRALRRLWRSVELACDIPSRRLLLAAETAHRMMTRHDPRVNMLRTTVAALSAGIGGADSIAVLPYSTAGGSPNLPADRRSARNGQLILLEEAHLAKVDDPGGGSGAIEALTEQLCLASWAKFQDIERSGGIVRAIRDNRLQDEVVRVADARFKSVASGRQKITGTTDFPDLSENVGVAHHAERVPSSEPQSTFSPLKSIRMSQPFEGLRERSDAFLTANGRRPLVLIAIASQSTRVADASFVRNLFESGGVVAQDGLFSDLTEARAAFDSSGADFCCICSDEPVSCEDAELAFESSATKRLYVLTSRHGEMLPTASQRHCRIIYPGVDSIDVLVEAYGALAAS